MGLLRTLVVGRDKGIRSAIRSRLFGRSGGARSDRRPDPRSAPPPPAERSLGLKPEPPRDLIPPEGFEVILHKDALAPGRVTEIIIGGTAIAVANVDGVFHAVSNSCAHADGPLGEGALEGSVLTCPYHGWQYDVSTGACLTSSDERLTTYEVRVVDTAVCVRL